MKKQLIICIFFLNVAALVHGQDNGTTMSGTVSFVTSSNVYIKFSSTKEIKIGETLQFSGEDCLRVVNKSSTSIVCTSMNNCSIKKGDTVTYKRPVSEEITANSTETQTEAEEVVPAEQAPVKPAVLEEESMYTEKIRGRASVASYNLFSDTREDRHRFLTRFL